MLFFLELLAIIFAVLVSSLINGFVLTTLAQSLLIYYCYKSSYQNTISLFIACLMIDIISLLPWGTQFIISVVILAAMEKFLPHISSQKIDMAIKGFIFFLLKLAVVF